MEMSKRHRHNTERRRRRLSQANAGGAQRLAPENSWLHLARFPPTQSVSTYTSSRPPRSWRGVYEIAARDYARYWSDERTCSCFQPPAKASYHAWKGKWLRWWP